MDLSTSYRGDNLISRELKWYYASFNLFVFSQGLIGAFLNLFFFANDSYVSVLYFQLFVIIGVTLAFIGSGYLLRSIKPKDLYAAGEIARVVILISLVAAAGFISNLFFFGILYGISGGLFWSGNNIITYDVTEKMDRNAFISFNNIASGVATFAAPFMAGVLIQFSLLRGPLRFLWDFAAAGAILGLSAVTIRRIGRADGEVLPSFSFRDTIIKGRSMYQKFKAYFFLSQIFAIPFLIILPIYVFQITGSYLIAGIFTSYMVLASVASNFIFRNGARRWDLFMRIAVLAIMLSSITLLMPKIIQPPWNAFLFTGLYTFFSTPLNNKAALNFYKLIDSNRDINRVFFWINREYYINIARALVVLLMFALLFVFRVSSLGLLLMLPFLTPYALIFLKVSHDGIPMKGISLIRGIVQKY